MIKFEDYSVRYTLMVDPESDVAFEGTKPFWGGFEIFSGEKGSNDVYRIACVKFKDKYLNEPKRMTSDEILKMNESAGLTFVWFSKKSDVSKFLNQMKNIILNFEETKKHLKDHKIFNFSGPRRVNLPLIYKASI